MNFGKKQEWQYVDGIEFRATVQGDHFEKHDLPTGKEEIRICELLSKKFGGSNWRRAAQMRNCASRSGSGLSKVETSDTWQNEYGVEVEVRT